MRVVMIIVQNDDGTVEARKPGDFSENVFPSSDDKPAIPDDSTTCFWKNRPKMTGWILKEALYNEMVRYCKYYGHPVPLDKVFFKTLKKLVDPWKEVRKVHGQGRKRFVWLS